MAYTLDNGGYIDANEPIEVLLGENLVSGHVFDAGGGGWSVGDMELIFLKKVNVPMRTVLPEKPGDIHKGVEIAAGGYISVLAHHSNDITVEKPIDVQFRKPDTEAVYALQLTRSVRLKDDLEIALAFYGMAEPPDDLYMLFLYKNWLR